MKGDKITLSSQSTKNLNNAMYYQGLRRILFGEDGLLSVKQTTDNHYILAGYTTKFFNANVGLIET